MLFSDPSPSHVGKTQRFSELVPFRRPLWHGLQTLPQRGISDLGLDWSFMLTGEQEGMQGLRVLVVDDYQDAADSLALLLRFYACEVQVALDGKAALALLQTWWPDAAVLDIGLPGMDGYRVAKFIRMQPVERSKPLLIALTGFGRDEDRLRCAAEGFAHHFVKPVDPARLIDLLRDRKSLVISH